MKLLGLNSLGTPRADSNVSYPRSSIGTCDTGVVQYKDSTVRPSHVEARTYRKYINTHGNCCRSTWPNVGQRGEPLLRARVRGAAIKTKKDKRKPSNVATLLLLPLLCGSTLHIHILWRNTRALYLKGENTYATDGVCMEAHPGKAFCRHRLLGELSREARDKRDKRHYGTLPLIPLPFPTLPPV